MGIRKTIAAVIAAAMVLSMTACANNEKTNNEGVVTNSNSSSTNKVFGIEDDVPVPPKQTSMWDVIPEIPVTDASAFTYKYDSELGGMVVTDYLRESPKVRIPDMIEGEPVVKVDFSEVYKELTQLVMPDSVKEFDLSGTIKSALQYINIPNNVTEIEGRAFSECKNLTSIIIPDNVIKIGDEAFYKCIGLTSVTIGNGVTEIGDGVFDSCKNLISVTMGNKVAKIGRKLFYKCENLSNVTMSDSLAEIGAHSFYTCTNVIVTYKGKTYDFEHIEGFANAVRCGENGMHIEDGVLIDVLDELTEVTIPDSVTRIGSKAFRSCTGLTSVTIPDSVIYIDQSAFSDCTNLTSINVANGNTKYFSVDGMLCEKHDDGEISFNMCPPCKTGSITIPDGVTKINSNAFNGCTNIAKIIMPDTLIKIESGLMGGTFSDCKKLTSINIPDNITEIGDVFRRVDFDSSLNTYISGCENIQATYKGKTYDYEHIEDLYKAIKGN